MSDLRNAIIIIRKFMNEWEFSSVEDKNEIMGVISVLEKFNQIVLNSEDDTYIKSLQKVIKDLNEVEDQDKITLIDVNNLLEALKYKQLEYTFEGDCNTFRIIADCIKIVKEQPTLHTIQKNFLNPAFIPGNHVYVADSKNKNVSEYEILRIVYDQEKQIYYEWKLIDGCGIDLDGFYNEDVGVFVFASKTSAFSTLNDEIKL